MKKKRRTIIILCISVLATEGIFSFLWSAGSTVGEKTPTAVIRTNTFGHSSVSGRTAAGTSDQNGLNAKKDRNTGGANNYKDIDTGSGVNDSSSLNTSGIKKRKKLIQKNPKTLVLVNAQNALEESYDASLIPICHGRLYASQYLYDALVNMLADAGNEGHQFWIASAWRSRERQQKLVDEDVRAAMQKGLSYEEALRQTYEETMPAGHSEHETGLALDILCSGNMNMDVSQEAEPGNIWLRENCWRYGFILRYPKDGESITGVNYEPWHFRFVGKTAAKYMKSHHLTLEEFWDGLIPQD